MRKVLKAVMAEEIIEAIVRLLEGVDFFWFSVFALLKGYFSLSLHAPLLYIVRMDHSTLDQLLNEGLEAITQSESLKSLYDVKVKIIGKNGLLSEAMKAMGKLPKEEKPAFGKKANEVKQAFEKAYEEREEALRQKELHERLSEEEIDVTLPGKTQFMGGRHPVGLVIQESVAALNRLGFSVQTGPQIEEDWYNFEALNIPPDHPSRDMQDTFYVDDTHVLRTHTSPIQIRSMLKSKPPLRIMAPGSVFRCDSDVTHSPNFHQIEGLLVDRKVSMAHLKATISFVLKELFRSKVEVRFRPSFFPFTEPSAEFDCSCPMCSGKGCRVCKQTGWIEIGGCGLVNPKVLEACEIDSKEWQGFAFGFGIERMAMIKYGIGDIRLFNENDLRFLRQFQK
tara:strand:- start:6221 stop:7402 length:1182 start_codon:yes stop_codon:yes gene_type:complete